MDSLTLSYAFTICVASLRQRLIVKRRSLIVASGHAQSSRCAAQAALAATLAPLKRVSVSFLKAQVKREYVIFRRRPLSVYSSVSLRLQLIRRSAAMMCRLR